MESVGFMWKVSVLMSMLLFAGCTWRAEAQLSAGFYSKSCPKALSIVRAGVRAAVSKEKRMAASLLRLHFHDCFVNGCDASILLDDNATFTGEKTAGPNVNSARGFEVIDDIKSKLESQCPSTVSCADILAIAARDSVVALGGPSWTVLLGRRDSTTASLSGANSNLPSPSSSKSTLVSMFAAQGLSEKDMVALSGSHTIGQARCVTFRGRIYNDSDIDAAFANSLKGSCPASAGSGDSNLAPLDAKSPNAFDNAYYRNLQSKRGTLHSDQQIADNPLVKTYSKNNAAFFRDFASAMLRMGNISPLTGSQGQIRTNCRVVNPS